ncbi:MAG: hypothetical protein NTY12_04145 [Candidatus Falkowbacteria bacterium]|nr:hypothetical protein [Candidatus Falkowbacteria bacterium]
MIYFTKYADKKFDILNDHKVYFRKEEIELTLQTPDIRGKIGQLLTAQRNNIKVVYQKEADIKRVITFYPV